MKISLLTGVFAFSFGFALSATDAQATFPTYCDDDYRHCLASGNDPGMCREYFNICRFGNQTRAAGTNEILALPATYRTD